MIKIIQYSLGELQANCYFIVNDKDCLIVDPGDEADFILEKLQGQNLHLRGVVATHGHFDHVMAVGEIQASFNIPLYIFKEDLFLLKRLKETADHFLSHKPTILPIKNIKYLKEENFQILNFKFQIISTPGHTPGSCCLYFKDEQVVFTGDTLFKDGIGRYDFSYSSKKDLFNSIKKILKLPEETTVYPGHGEETSVFKEKNSPHLF